MVDMRLNTVFPDPRCTYIVSTGRDGGHESKYSVSDHHCTYIVSTGRDGGHESKYSVSRSSLYLHSVYR